jgi:hypothetical protein
LSADALARLRADHSPTPGLLVHDWDDGAAVVFVPGANTTHLIDGTTASLLADWHQPIDATDAGWLTAQLEAQVPTLLQAGILVRCPA